MAQGAYRMREWELIRHFVNQVRIEPTVCGITTPVQSALMYES